MVKKVRSAGYLQGMYDRYMNSPVCIMERVASDEELVAMVEYVRNTYGSYSIFLRCNPDLEKMARVFNIRSAVIQFVVTVSVYPIAVIFDGRWQKLSDTAMAIADILYIHGAGNYGTLLDRELASRLSSEMKHNG